MFNINLEELADAGLIQRLDPPKKLIKLKCVEIYNKEHMQEDDDFIHCPKG